MPPDQALGLPAAAEGISFEDLGTRWSELGPAMDEARQALVSET